MSWTNAAVTEAGLALQAKLVDGQTLGFLRVAAGTGTVDPSVLANQTALANEKQTLTFQPPNVLDGAKIKVPVMLNNIGLESGYTMQQLGFFAEDPDNGEILYAIVQDEVGDTVPSQTESPGFVIEWAFVFQYGNASEVTVKLDPVGLVSIGMVGAPNGVAGLDDKGAVPIEQGGTGETTVQGVVDAFGIFLAISAAAVYDPEGSYAVGDYCTHAGKLHKCGTPIPDGEAWNAAHWTATTVAAELENKIYQVGDISAELFDDPTHSNGYFASVDDVGNPMPDIPASGHWRLLYLPYFAASEGWSTQIAVGAVENSGLCWRKASGTKWQPWEFAAIAKPPESVAIPLNSGFTGTLRAERNQFGQVLLTGAVAAESINANDLIATLPDGFLPKASEENFSAVSNRGADGNSFATLGQISSDGNVNLWRAIPNNYAANTYLVINHNYQART